MTERVTFLARCLDCGEVIDTTSAIEHTCTTNYWNTTYNETRD